jgi:signal peptidase I
MDRCTVFGIIVATFIRVFFCGSIFHPTSSMERSLLVGDYLFVSKISYGPKLPNTPSPFLCPSYTALYKECTLLPRMDKLPFKRLAGFSSIKNNDVIVFNFPKVIPW